MRGPHGIGTGHLRAMSVRWQNAGAYAKSLICRVSSAVEQRFCNPLDVLPACPAWYRLVLLVKHLRGSALVLVPSRTVPFYPVWDQFWDQFFDGNHSARSTASAASVTRWAPPKIASNTSIRSRGFMPA